MKSLGLRVSPRTIFFCIVELKDEQVDILVTDKIIVPYALETPDKLSFVRILVYTIINQYKIDNAIIRRNEDGIKKVDINRLNIEGVLQELVSNCRIMRYKIYKLSQLGTLLKCSASDLKSCINGDNLYGIKNWDKYKKEERESILCALAATEL